MKEKEKKIQIRFVYEKWSYMKVIDVILTT